MGNRVICEKAVTISYVCSSTTVCPLTTVRRLNNVAQKIVFAGPTPTATTTQSCSETN